MPQYSTTSLRRVGELHQDLAGVVLRVGEVWDCSVLCGYRGETEQESRFQADESKARFGESPHNYQPALAVDLWPYPIDWLDLDRARVFVGHVIGYAAALGVRLEWGGDWYNELRTRASHDRPRDKRVGFVDMLHFQLANWRRLIQGGGR